MVGSIGHGTCKIQNSYASCKIIVTKANRAGGVVAYPGYSSPKIDTCFFVGTASEGVFPLYSTIWSLAAELSNCYSVMNSTKVYTNGDFSTFQVIPGINQGYPVMSELFSIVQEPNGTAVLDFFSKNGFSRI